MCLCSQAWKSYRSASAGGIEGNVVGNGGVCGGLFVIRKGGAGVQFVHAERVLGDFATAHEVRSLT